MEIVTFIIKNTNISIMKIIFSKTTKKVNPQFSYLLTALLIFHLAIAYFRKQLELLTIEEL